MGKYMEIMTQTNIYIFEFSLEISSTYGIVQHHHLLLTSLKAPKMAPRIGGMGLADVCISVKKAAHSCPAIAAESLRHASFSSGPFRPVI